MNPSTFSPDDPDQFAHAPCLECGDVDAVSLVGELACCQRCGWLRPLRRNADSDSQAAIIEELKAVAPDGVLRGRYRLIREIGRGAHGVSVLARHVFLDHPCVLKFLPHAAAECSKSAVQRLRKEARSGFRISDPHVIRVLDCDEIGGVWYFATEFIDGISLDRIVAAPIDVPWQQAAKIACDSAAGLVAIHRAGLVHRDIKPSNLIMGSDGRTRVGDLGVAAFARAETGRFEDAGTLAYMAPEALTPEDAVGDRGDLYSWGATFYHLLTRRLPHERAGPVTRLLDRHNKPAEWPAGVRDETPPWFKSAILRCLAIDPADRFADAQALLAHLLRGGAQKQPPSQVVSAVEALEPRGLAVLPFENLGGSRDDDWLGIAVAELLAAELAQLPGVYVADREQLLKTADDLDIEGDRNAGLVEAGRLVGAGTIIGGEFRRHGEDVELVATILRTGQSSPQPIGGAAGAVSDLSQLRKDILDCVVRSLQLKTADGAASARPAATLSPVAQEKYHHGLQAFFREGDYQKAADLAREAVELDPNFAEPLGFIGACCARLGRYDDAAMWQGKLERIAEQRGDRQLLVEAWANQGLMYWLKGDYEEARDYCGRAAELARQEGRLTELAQINNNLGFVYLRMGRLTEAETAFGQAIATHRSYGALMALIAPYNGLGNVLAEQARYDEAASYYRQALELAQRIGDLAKVGVSHMNLGRVASLRREFATANNEFTRAFNALDQTTFWNGLARWYEYVADMNIELGNYAHAILCADKRIESARSHANRGVERSAWLQKAHALELAGHLEQAAACKRQAESDPQPQPE